jgi:[ribosomal protein S5]-alanine N-acetyltransferase
MIFLDTVETHRLRGERIHPRHWGMWRSMGADPALMATLGGTWTEEQAREKLLWNCDQWARHGHGQWLFFLKDGGALVGRSGIRKMVVNGKEEVELGYAVLPELWGKSFAPEMGGKALEVAFESFHYPSVVAFTLVGNRRSERVIQRLGFSFEAEIIHAGLPHVLYRLAHSRQGVERSVGLPGDPPGAHP